LFIFFSLVLLLVGREGFVGGDEIGGDKDNIEIADYENFFFINYIDRGTVSSHSVNFVINIITAVMALVMAMTVDHNLGGWGSWGSYQI
jgi:hypothetical protein